MTLRTETTGRRKYIRRLIVSLLFSVACVPSAYADREPPEEPESDVESQEKTIEPLHFASIHSGYRFITPDGPSAAASPYGRPKSGVTGGFSAGTLGSDLKLLVDATFLHEDDYQSELFFDYRGLVRFHAESQALWSNPLAVRLSEQIRTTTVEPRQLDSDTVYGLRSSLSQADTRIKLGNRPVHLNLGYWELNREGSSQLIFSDYYRTGNSSIIAASNRINHTIREGSAGLDAHLGILDLSYGFRIRNFSNNAEVARYDSYSNNANGALITTPGSHAHDVVPDSAVTSHTIKLFSDLSGGLVGAASYNLTQRENNGGNGDATPGSRPSDLLQTVTGDLSYTPSKRHFFALKYRHREIDRTTPSSLFYPYSQIPSNPPGVYTSTPGVLLIRPSSSSTRDSLTFSATFRPGPKVIYRLEYNAELEERNNIRNAQSAVGSPSEVHPDRRQTHTGTATFYWKPVKGGKLNATYSYATCDNPAYDSSFSDRHIGKLLATYTNSTKWGLAASYLAQYDSNETTSLTIPATNLVTAETSVKVNKPRSGGNNSLNANLWFNPLERLTISTNYSFLQSHFNQTVLLTDISENALSTTNYSSMAHIYGVGAMYAATEQLDLSLAFQQTRSNSRFDVPPGATFNTTSPTTYSSDGIGDQTRLSTTETGVSARADWRITQLLGCSLDYSMRTYKSGNPLYDGSVHATMVSLKARW